MVQGRIGAEPDQTKPGIGKFFVPQGICWVGFYILVLNLNYQLLTI